MMMWTLQLDGGPRRVNHAAVAIRRRYLFTFGGYCTGEDYNKIEKMDIHVFDNVLCRWFRLQDTVSETKNSCNIPYMRYGHTASVIGLNVYIFGGRNDRYGACNSLYCFDTTTLTWSVPSVSGALPAARDGHSACVVGKKIYIFGGFEDVRECFNNEFHFIDTTTMTWYKPNTRGTPPLWRDFHTATLVGTDIYIFGGRTYRNQNGPFIPQDEIYPNSLTVFNTVNNTWQNVKTTGDRPIGRRSHSAVSHGKYIYLFGGYNGRTMEHFGDLHKYDTEKKVWQRLSVAGPAPCPRRRHVCCCIGSQLVVYGGTSPIIGSHVVDEYNLRDHSDLYVLDLEPSLRTLCKIAVVQHKLDQSCLPEELRHEISILQISSQVIRQGISSSQG